MVVDFLFTALILVFLLSLIVLPLQRRKFAKASTVVQPPFAFIRYLGWAAGYRDSVKSLLLALTAVVASLPPVSCKEGVMMSLAALSFL